MADAPAEAGARKVSTALAFAGVALCSVGAPGAPVEGVTLAAVEGALVPTALNAVTMQE